MINSDFDTIIRNESNFSNKKNNKLTVILIIIIVLVLGIVGFLGYSYYSSYKAKLPKIKFFEYIDDSNIGKIFDTSLFNAINQKISSSSCSIKNEIKIESTNMFANLLSSADIDLNYYKNNNSSKAEFVVNKANEELFNYAYINDGTNVGIRFKDIAMQNENNTINYFGSKSENIDDLILKLTSENSAEETEKEKIVIPDKNKFQIYYNLVSEKLIDDKFQIEENVLLTQNEASLQTTVYRLVISKQEIMQILEQVKTQFVNDDELLNLIITGKQSNSEDNQNLIRLLQGYKMDFTLEQAKTFLEEKYTELYETISGLEDFNLSFDIYVNEGKVIKKQITCGKYLEIEIEEQEKQENENNIKLTILTTDENNQKNGMSININRLNNNVSTIINSEISLIENMGINNKLTINMTLEGNENSTNLNNKITCVFNNKDDQFNLTINSNTEFGYDGEIEILNGENCLFLDELNNENLKNIIVQLKDANVQIFNSNLTKLLMPVQEEGSNPLDGFVNMDGDSQEEQNPTETQNPINTDPSNTTNELSTAEQLLLAQNKLISAVSEAMRKAQEEGKEYTIADLQNLQILGSTVSVMVGENMAIITIDGNTFYIDPNFVLTTE